MGAQNEPRDLIVMVQNKIEVRILCDLSSDSGLGHLTRCINLSKAMENLGCNCEFLVEPHSIKIFKKHFPEGKIIDLNFNNITEQLLRLLYTNPFNVLLIDSYHNLTELEARLKIANVFVVSIDDHLMRHDGNLVFNNRSSKIKYELNNPKFATWHIGNEFVLAKAVENQHSKVRSETKIKKVLLHAGGASAYGRIKPLVYETVSAAKNYQFALEILCTTPDARKFIADIADELEILNNVEIIPYTKNLRSNLINYDIVVGPAGTTTYECLISNVLPFSVALDVDGRDSPESWPYLGHLLHLNFEEAQNRVTISDLWDFTNKNFEWLTNLLASPNHKLDGQGPEHTATVLVESYKKASNQDPDRFRKNDINIKLTSRPCEIGDCRAFLSARNQAFVRYSSSDPTHIISWPEHLNWWLKNNVNRFCLCENEKIIAFHWTKLVSDELGNFVISGWMPAVGTDNKLRAASKLIQDQVKYLKTNYAGNLWLICMRKQNVVAKSLNTRAGFKSAKESSIYRAENIFCVSRKEFDFMEMHL